MLKKQRRSSLNNEKGMAVFEMIPIIMVIMLLLNFSLGFFGAIHTGIVNSIAARNYTFETFRNRSNLNYFKNTSKAAINTHYADLGMRLHGSTSEMANSSSKWMASSRTIDFVNFDNRAAEIMGADQNTHKKVRETTDGRNTNVGVNPIWIKTAYGICINAACGS